MGIYKKIMTSVSLLVAVILITVCFGQIYYVNNQAKDNVEQKASTTAENISAAVGVFVWEMDTDAINSTLKRFLSDPDISYIDVFDSNNKAMNNKKSKKFDFKVIKISKDILNEGQKVGKVTLGYNLNRIKNEIYEISLIISGVVIGFLALVIIVIHFLLKKIIRPLTKTSEKLSSTVNELNNSADTLYNSGGELFNTVNSQASSLQQSSASLEELTGILDKNYDSTCESNEHATEVLEFSKRGNNAMEELVSSMQDILKSNDNIQELVTILSKISEKTKIIDEIVFQTKLLSFNASVEAERAGEHGRGFAVVAQEIGTLAQTSGNAATEIADIIRDSISSAENITSENKKKVESGNYLVDESRKIFQEIYKKSETVTSFSKKAIAASKEQSIGLQEINGAVSMLDSSTQITTEIAGSTSDSSKKIKEEAEGLAIVAEELTKFVVGS